MLKFLNKTVVVGICVGVLLCIGLITYYLSTVRTSQVHDSATFDPKAILAKVNTNDSLSDFLEIENMIGETMKQYGTKAGFELIDEGERQGLISNDACHGLLHYVGHAAFAENPQDYEALLSVVEGTNCIGGYLHGIEAEIVLQSSNVVVDVQNFCTFQKEKRVNPGPCYHGVGHAAIELYGFDIHKSLALCDGLYGEPERDLSNCYRGVFSEIGNLVTGYDGHTGLSIDVEQIPDLNPEKPYAYCEMFDQKYQSSCKSQLTKIVTKDLPIEEWGNACTDASFGKQSKEICVNITSGVYVRQQLSFQNTTSLPKSIDLLDFETQKIAVLGSAEAFSGYFSDGAQKDWKSFCSSFTNPDIVSYCNAVFTEMETNNTAPWMERVDIR